ncbi:MAG: amidase family protein [Chloroflexi bacterium]|nr:amidase family protein [Chloroflexota bacterium]
MLYDDYATQQARRQKALRSFQRGKPLNFRPFEAQLASFEARASRVARLVRGADIPRLCELLRSGALLSVDLTLHYLRRIRRTENLNAVMQLAPDALAQARAADRVRTAGANAGALHGIPVLIKDNIGTGDQMHTTAGAAVLQRAHCDRDAMLVRRLRESGAVLLGKTNLSEWANFFADEPAPNGFSANGGQTRNPYGVHDVGGSSSGSGSAVAAGLCAAAVGTETHGSIVNPSLCNALYGMKPSLGLISRDRVIPITDATDTAGPMARTATDMAVLMDALIGFDPNDPACVDLAADPQGPALFAGGVSAALQQDGLRDQRIGLLDSRGTGAIYRGAFTQMRRMLKRAGAVLVPLKMPKFDPPFFDIMSHGYVHGVAEYLSNTNAPVRSLGQVAEYNRRDLARRAPNGMGTLESALTNNTWTRDEYDVRVREWRAAARASIDEALHSQNLDLIATFNPFGFDERFVLAGAPLLALPAGFLPNGRPYGFILAGRWLDDAALVAVAGAWERSR